MFSSMALHAGLALLLLSPVSALGPFITKAIDAYLADHPIVTRSASAAASQSSLVDTKHATAAEIPDWTSPISNVSRRRCPSPYSNAGLDSHGWPVYHSVDRLGWCDQPMLLDFALFNHLDDEKTHISLAACAADLSTASVTGNTRSTTSELCLPDTNLNNTEKVTAQLQLVSFSSTQSGTADDDDKDKKLNSKTTSWYSGSPVSPPCVTGDKCGIPCDSWCDSGCPFCPPGLIGSSGGGSSSSDPDDDDDDDDDDNDNNDDNDSSTTTTTTTTTTGAPYTAAGFHIDPGDTLPTAAEPWSEIQSFLAELTTDSSDGGSGSSTGSDGSSSTGSNGGTTTTTSKATTITSTVSTPSATSGASEVIFGLFELYSGYTWIFEWMLMDAIIGEDFYPCDTSSDISTSADTVAPNPAFPDKDIGLFESHGIEGCQYTSGNNNNDVGSMTCPGVNKIICEKDESYGLAFLCDGGGLLVIVMHCYW
ncbi:hypothetical protein BDV19DRAFT_393482 [Aspergillus venezuelensis]